MLQSTRFKYHMETTGIDLSLIISALFEHRCLQNINKLYHHSGNCDNQRQLKYILEATMVSTPEGFTNNSPVSTMTPTQVKKQNEIKLLRILTNTLDVKMKTDIRQVGAAK